MYLQINAEKSAAYLRHSYQSSQEEKKKSRIFRLNLFAHAQRHVVFDRKKRLL